VPETAQEKYRKRSTNSALADLSDRHVTELEAGAQGAEVNFHCKDGVSEPYMSGWSLLLFDHTTACPTPRSAGTFKSSQ